MTKHVKKYFDLVSQISSLIDLKKINIICAELNTLRENNGRLFFLGVGGSAANCSHAVNDFRKLCNIESYAATDNVSELTARINDDGWDGSFVEYLKSSNIKSKDAIFILSVGGGNIEKNVSVNLINAINYCKNIGSKIFGIVGKDGGYTFKNGDNILLVPDLDKKLTTPLAESFQAVVWHCIVSNPLLQLNSTKW
ncbi:SIS domain-containing protein [bacterium]|jgi:D-sedoheptulose 7-phosphate isomerase|nr:SIS domain-containing protein [bacterium]